MSFAPEARVVSDSPFRMRRGRGSILSAVTATPRAISFLRRNGVGCLRRLIFLHQPVRDASGGILFSGSSEKSMQKRDAGERNSAYAPEKLFVSLYVLSFCFRRLNALRAVVQSGFPIARYTVRVALFAPAEYLTYGSRKAVLPARAALRIARNDFPCKGHPKQAQSISTTTPVYQRRICGAFCKLKKATARTKLRGKSKEGGRSPLLGRFKGIAKGRGLPRESSEAIRVGKGGTTERTTPVRRKRRTG